MADPKSTPDMTALELATALATAIRNGERADRGSPMFEALQEVARRNEPLPVSLSGSDGLTARLCRAVGLNPTEIQGFRLTVRGGEFPQLEVLALTPTDGKGNLTDPWSEPLADVAQVFELRPRIPVADDQQLKTLGDLYYRLADAAEVFGDTQHGDFLRQILAEVPHWGNRPVMPNCVCGHPNNRHGLGHPCNVQDCDCPYYRARRPDDEIAPGVPVGDPEEDEDG